MAAFTLPTPPGFKYVPTIWSHGWYQLPPFTYDEHSRRLERIHQLTDGRVVNLRIDPADDDRSLAITIEGLPGALTASQRDEISGIVTRCLALDKDMNALYAWLRDKPRYAWVERSGAGRIMASATVWEDLAKTLLTTNTTWNMTKQMCRRLCALGEPYNGESYTFPTPERIASMSLDELSERVRAGYRNAYLHELATSIASGKVDVEVWASDGLDSLELYKEVKALKGFGDYAAGSMLRILGRHDRLSIDTIARDVYKDLINNGQKPTDAEIRTYYEGFGEWRGLVQWMDIMYSWLEEVIRS